MPKMFLLIQYSLKTMDKQAGVLRLKSYFGSKKKAFRISPRNAHNIIQIMLIN
jgi:hypothetical protein